MTQCLGEYIVVGKSGNKNKQMGLGFFNFNVQSVTEISRNVQFFLDRIFFNVTDNFPTILYNFPTAYGQIFFVQSVS